MADPTGSIAGCLLWLKADAGVYNDAGSTLATDTQTVQQWNDQSGNGSHATQATSGKRPVYRTNVVNGLPALRFDASDDALTSITLSSTPWTIFVVYAQRGTHSTRRALSGSNNWLVGPYSGLHNSFFGGFMGDSKTPVVREDFAHVCVTNNGTTGKLYVGNVDHTGANATGSPGTLYIAGGSGAFIDPLDGDVAEVVVYNSVLLSGDRQLVFDYLAAKYGGTGGSTITDPVGVSGCKLWLDAAVSAYEDNIGTVPADGDAVYGWYDKSGNGWRAIQTSGTLKPIYKTGIINGLPVLRFDGSDDYMNLGLYLERPYTVFLVHVKKGAGGGNARAVAGSGNWFMGSGAGYYRHFAGSDYVSNNVLAETVDAPKLGTARNTGAANGSTYWIDQADITSQPNAIGVCGSMAVGSGPGGGDYYNGDVAEVLVYDTALSPADRQLVWDYLGPKYGLFASSAVSLPQFRVAFIG